MGEQVRIEHGHVRIDAAGWVAQRTAAQHADLTDLLWEWGRLEPLSAWVGWDWTTRAELWCQARGYPIAEGFPLTHDHPWLSAQVSVLLAAVPQAGAVAIVSINGHAPHVYADVTTDEGYWYDAGSVQIVCPNEHRWTWRDGELLTDDDEAVNPATLLDHHPATNHPDGDTAAADDLDVDDDDRVFCPRCDEVCDIRLPDVPTIAARRHFTVTVSDATDYRGWVLAADADHAQNIALEMIAERVLDTDGGNLAVAHLDREVSAFPATDVCWQCGEDPRLPHPRCSHPAPGHSGGALPHDPGTASTLTA
jgi:hypothetical protein